MRPRSFPPLLGSHPRLLILGSLPGSASLAAGQYYAHPRNQFWRLMGAVTGAAALVDMGYPDRLETLRAAGIGLWDVIGSASRRGSLDAAIRDHAPNELSTFTATLPSLRAIAFNGGKASEIGRRQLGANRPFALVTLPSSSPAYTLPLAGKVEAWLHLRRFLAPSG